MRQRTYPFKDNRSNGKRKEQRESKFYPRGFNISLAEVLSEFVMGDAEIKELGSNKSIASAFVGKTVYYRRSQLETLFTKITRAEPIEYDDEELEMEVRQGPDGPIYFKPGMEEHDMRD